MSSFGWRSRTKRARDSSVKEQDEILDALIEEGKQTPSELRIYRHVDAGVGGEDRMAFPFRFGGDPFPYYRFSPYFFGGNAANPPSARQQSTTTQGQASRANSAKQTSTKKPQPPSAQPPTGQLPEGQYPSGYGYYPYHGVYPASYGYPPQYPYPYPYQANQGGAHGAPGAPAQEPSEHEDDAHTVKSGMMSIQGRRPLFLVALFVVSIAVLLVSFPLTLLAAGYIGPLGLMFATGPFATVFAFWAIYLTPCECYPNVEWATSRIRVFATTAAVFDAVGTIGVPISMYGAQCPDDDDSMLGCEDELPAAKGISLAVAVVLGTHCFLCLLVRSNARKLAESKFGDERTEGIVLTPTPFNQ